jgi:hypothetical protein
MLHDLRSSACSTRTNDVASELGFVVIGPRKSREGYWWNDSAAMAPIPRRRAKTPLGPGGVSGGRHHSAVSTARI